jgi:hypothetical protein
MRKIVPLSFIKKKKLGSRQGWGMGRGIAWKNWSFSADTETFVLLQGIACHSDQKTIKWTAQVSSSLFELINKIKCLKYVINS